MLEPLDWSESLILTTGGEEEAKIIDLRDEFFELTSRNLGFVSLSIFQNPFIELKTSSLGTEVPSGLVVSDDRVHQMLVCNELIAMTFDRRNDGNYHEVTFWSRNPSEICQSQITRLIGTKRVIKD